MPTLRLAPTPSGFLHLGNGVNFVLTAAAAQHLDAELYLRIDDLDRARLRPAYLDDIAAQVRWLFPALADGLLDSAQHQHARLSRYRELLNNLADGDLVYACTCTRRDLAQLSAGAPDVNAYPGLCRRRGLSLATPGAVWRMHAGDTVVRQRDGTPSYQLASLADDVDRGVTHLVRGEDLQSSTDLQRVLAQALSPVLPEFAAFAKTRAYHHPLVRDADGGKLSKSAGALSLRQLRAGGLDPAQVLAKAGQLIGHPSVNPLDALAAIDWDAYWQTL